MSLINLCAVVQFHELGAAYVVALRGSHYCAEVALFAGIVAAAGDVVRISALKSKSTLAI